ncbi:MAG: hypothetical protein EXX96DRAFT_567600 [Benjaminiella poitrasii]|nr:MAG: hypothetical protein EXX96DRAFT_567600 [Benjaminiella poitrasii]
MANRIKSILTLVGVDTTIFEAHSTRYTSRSKTFLEDIDLIKLKQHVCQILQCNTLECYYLRPQYQHNASKKT